MDDYVILTEDGPQLAKQAEVRALTSKIKGINSYLATLLQKKIRLELEIRRTKQRLSKLKKMSMTIVKTSIQVEGLHEVPEDPSNSQIYFRVQPLLDFDIQRFEEAARESDSLIQEVQYLEENGRFTE